MKNLEYYLKRAGKERWVLGQFNFSDLSQLAGIIEAANSLKSPIILGTSEGESRFLGLKRIVDLKKSYQTELEIPIFLNLDHGKSIEYIKRAIEVGYDMVHFDGSNFSLEENVSRTKEIIKYARKFNVLVEGEIGVIGTETSKVYNKKFIIKKEDLTNPQEAIKYVNETGVNCLAINIGNFHGISTYGNPHLDLERLKQIKKAVKNVFLVLHGGSGILSSEIKKAIKIGIVKININTELRLAYTETLKKIFKLKPTEIIPYKYLPKAKKAVKTIVEEKIKLFRSKNKI